MKTKLYSLTIILVALIAGSLQAQVSSDYDRNADFTKYKTYTFKGWEKDSDKQLNDLDKSRIENAFKSELGIRGLTKDDSNPDVVITLYIVIEKKTSTTAYTDFNGGLGYGAGWGWGMGAGMGAGMGSATTTYSENDYNVGTIVIDFYDENSKKLVYQGTLTTTVKEKAQKREKSIPKNVAKLMSKYPIKPSK